MKFLDTAPFIDLPSFSTFCSDKSLKNPLRIYQALGPIKLWKIPGFTPHSFGIHLEIIHVFFQNFTIIFLPNISHSLLDLHSLLGRKLYDTPEGAVFSGPRPIYVGINLTSNKMLIFAKIDMFCICIPSLEVLWCPVPSKKAGQMNGVCAAAAAQTAAAGLPKLTLDRRSSNSF